MDNDNSLKLISEYETRVLRDAEQLQMLFKTTGWTTIVQPLIDKMINDSIGYKNGNLWTEGNIGRSTMTTHEIDKIVWYRKALIEFNNALHNTLAEAEKIKLKLKLEAERKTNTTQKKESFIPPLLDTSYANLPEGQDDLPDDPFQGGLISGA